MVRPKLGEMVELLGDDFVLNTLVMKEFAFDWKLQFVTVRVLSSIPRMENFGEEFIRVCMLHGSEREVDDLVSCTLWMIDGVRTPCSGLVRSMRKRVTFAYCHLWWTDSPEAWSGMVGLRLARNVSGDRKISHRDDIGLESFLLQSSKTNRCL